jgi:DNA-binding transcriptional MerR regulator
MVEAAGVDRSLDEAHLRRMLAREDLSLEALIEAADVLLPAIAPDQTRYKVRERPDVRTIRYYVSQGLLPKPLGYDGGRARYGGAHLARLLLLKRRQAEHETLSRIARELAALDDAQVIERLLGRPRDARPRRVVGPQRPRPPSEPETESESEPQPAPTDVSGTPDAGARGPARRLTLAPGGTLELPLELLADPAARRTLADNLESLAQWLRATTTELEVTS